MIDTGSPISMIKQKFILSNQLKIDSDCSSFFEINGSKLDILGILETNIKIDNYIFRMKFKSRE